MRTIADLLDELLADAALKKRPKPVRAYHVDLSAAARHLTAPLDILTLAEVERVLALHDAAPSTIARRAASLTRFFDWAIRRDYCTKNPLDRREAVRRGRRLPRPIRSRTERAAVDQAIKAADQP